MKNLQRSIARRGTNVRFWMFIAAVLLGLAGVIHSTILASAADSVVSGLKISSDSTGPFFVAANIAPGYEEVRKLTITNTAKVNRSFSIAASGEIGELGNIIQIEPRLNGQALWRKSLAEIKNNNSTVVINSILPNETKEVRLAVIFPVTAGNEFQGKTASLFSFIIGNESTDPVETSSGYALTSSLPPITASASRQLAVNKPTTPLVSDVETVDTAVSEPTPKIETSSDSLTPTVKGESASDSDDILYGWILLVLFAIFLYIFGRIAKKRQIRLLWPFPLFIGLLLNIAYVIIERYITVSPTTLLFAIISAVEYLLFLTFHIYSSYEKT